jgi:hypothetical protein
MPTAKGIGTPEGDRTDALSSDHPRSTNFAAGLAIARLVLLEQGQLPVLEGGRLLANHAAGT